MRLKYITRGLTLRYDIPKCRGCGMCVEVCAYSAYLSGILTSNPGMLDGLMDSLVLDRLPTRELMVRVQIQRLS